MVSSWLSIITLAPRVCTRVVDSYCFGRVKATIVARAVQPTMMPTMTFLWAFVTCQSLPRSMFSSFSKSKGCNSFSIGYYDSVGTLAEEYSLDGLEQVHEIDPDGPVADVPSIHGDALFVGGVAAAAGLPHAGDAGQNHAVLAEIDAVALDFFGDNRARADEAHVAADDVPELRQLVEAGLAEEGAELCDARVVLELEVRFPLLAGLGVLPEVLLKGLLGVWDHGLELIARKEPAIFADALVGEDDMALVVDGDDEEEGQQDG